MSAHLQDSFGGSGAGGMSGGEEGGDAGRYSRASLQRAARAGLRGLGLGPQYGKYQAFTLGSNRILSGNESFLASPAFETVKQEVGSGAPPALVFGLLLVPLPGRVSRSGHFGGTPGVLGAQVESPCCAGRRDTRS